MVRSIAVSQMDPSFNEQNNYNHKINEMNRLKRNTLTLDLQNDPSKIKRNKFGPGVHEAQVLSSPDMKGFNLDSPDIEKFIVETNILQTPTPNTMRILFPKSVSDDQELFNENFPLNDLNSDSSHGNLQLGLTKNYNGNLSMNNYLIDNQYPVSLSSNCDIVISPELVKVKDEPQTVPSVGLTPPVSPINMESQEQIKSERKKARNRVAAAKCRQKKLQKIATLEDKVKQLKDENSELGQVVARLKKEVFSLKEKVLKHHNNGCLILPANGPNF
ncbi:hypothetical protein PGB90_004390 [Kerria lacca]